MSPREPPPEFFIDRSLGRRHLAEALRAHGLVVHTMASVYGEEQGQRVPDERWLRDAGGHGWIVLMKDDAIRRRPAERDALVEAGVRAFCLTNAQLRAAEQTERFVSNRHRILQQARKPGPYIYLERMTNEIAGWQAQLPPRAGHGIAQALRQVLDAAVRWERMTRNPAKLAGRNRKPPPRPVRAFSLAEVDAISAELSPIYARLPPFVAATGLRPEEWQALQRRDLDRRAGTLSVRRTVSSGAVVELGKTDRSRRQVPLSPRALAAYEQLPVRLDTPLLFPAPAGGLLNLDNFRRREWSPAIEASGVRRPARIYDLRSSFASNALAAGVSIFELARVMGTSIEMIERHYGALLDGSGAGIASRLAAFEAEHGSAADSRATDV